MENDPRCLFRWLLTLLAGAALGIVIVLFVQGVS